MVADGARFTTRFAGLLAILARHGIVDKGCYRREGISWPCLPTSAPQPPSGAVWLHEIKHDGFRVIARKAGERVRLYSRPGNDLTYRFPLIVEAVAKLRSQSCYH